MKRAISLTLIFLWSLSGLTVSVSADVLTIPDTSSQPANSSDGIVRPNRGMTMEQVRQEFGDPQQIVEPVGDPPISRWVYDQFTVHFEHKYVIHSVITKSK